MSLVTEKYEKFDWLHQTKEEYLNYFQAKYTIELAQLKTNQDFQLQKLAHKYDQIKSNNYVYYALNQEVVPKYLTQQEFDEMVLNEVEDDLVCLNFFLPNSKKNDDLKDIESGLSKQDIIRRKLKLKKKLYEAMCCHFVVLLLIVVGIIFLGLLMLKIL